MAHPTRVAVKALLQAIERRDLHAMERSATALRGSLCPRPDVVSLEAEHLDALSGIAEEIERALRRMRTSAAGEMARIRAAAPLLEHLALGESGALTLQH